MEWFKKKNPPWRRHGMARMVIGVSGQRQKHGASQLGEIATWLLQFSGDHQLTTPDPPLLRQNPLFCSRRQHCRHCRCSCRHHCYQRHRAVGLRRRRCPCAAAAAAAESSAATFS